MSENMLMWTKNVYSHGSSFCLFIEAEIRHDPLENLAVAKILPRRHLELLPPVNIHVVSLS